MKVFVSHQKNWNNNGLVGVYLCMYVWESKNTQLDKVVYETPQYSFRHRLGTHLHWHLLGESWTHTTHLGHIFLSPETQHFAVLKWGVLAIMYMEFLMIHNVCVCVRAHMRVCIYTYVLYICIIHVTAFIKIHYGFQFQSTLKVFSSSIINCFVLFFSK